MHLRSFNALVVLVLISSLVITGSGVVAAPLDNSGPASARHQQDPSTPPLIEPSDGSTPVDAAPEEEEAPGGNPNLLPITLGQDLGNGGQPDGLPRELGVGEQLFLYDRIVSLERQNLARISQDASLIVYAASDTGTFDAVYVSVPNRSEDELARYLPERLEAPDVACPAEAAEIGRLDAGDAVYVFAGFETDLTPDTLQEVGSSEGSPVYADVGAGQPFPEVFSATGDGLLRFVMSGGDGRPAALAESLAFDGALYSFVGDVTDQFDPASLLKAGCAGPYPVYADQAAADATTANRYVRIGGRLFQFSGEVVPDDAATEAPATDVPTEEPPVASPTSVPTDVPTEVATEAPTAVPTEAPTEAPTEVPTEVPTEAVTEEPTIAATEAPAEAMTEEPVAAVTEEPTEAVTEEPAITATEAPAEGETPEVDATETPAGLPAGIVEQAGAAGLPPQVEVQNTSYVFTDVDIDIDVQTLVEIEVVTVNDISVTVYAEQALQGVAPVLYCVAEDGSIGRFVPVASTNPAPPAELPPSIEVANTTYVFNQVNVDIDITTLIEVEVIVVQNVELTIYTDLNVDGQPSRFFAVTSEGQVVGQYVDASLIVSTQVTPQPTAQLQPPAVVPTQAPDAPPPAAVTAEAAVTCPGSPGPVNDAGIPAYLPNRIQLGGVAYGLVGPQEPGEAGELTRIGCIGAFEVLTTDQAERSEVLYLRAATVSTVFRFEAAVTFNVEFEVTGRPQRITTTEQQYRLIDTWLPSIYSSTSVILFVEDAETTLPDVFYAVNVYNTVVGEVVGEYRQAEQNAQPSEDIVEAAANAGINPDLTVDGQRYLLANVYSPVGTTTNGFVTLFSATGEGEAEILLGRDKRRVELFIYDVIPAEETGG